MQIDKTPPNDYEAERGLLACLFSVPEYISKAEYEISPDDFYNYMNQKLYGSIIGYSKKYKLSHHSYSVYITSDHKLLEHLIRLDLTGFESYQVSEEQFRMYVSVVKNLSLRRKQIDLSIKIINDAYVDKVDPLANIEELRSYLEKAKSGEDIGIVEVSQISEEIDRLYEHGFQRGVLTGWPSLDQHYTVKLGEMTLVTGIPSHGKSTFLTNLLVNIASKESWKIAVFSPENQPIERYVAHLCQIYAGKPFDLKHADCMTKGMLEYSKEWTNNHFVFLSPKDDELKFDSIMKKAVICCLKHGIKGLVLDPWNEVDHTRPPGLSETEYISKCLTKIRYFARTYKVHVWLIAHPTKLTKRQDGTYPIPTPYDISGSSHFRNKADCCLCVWRDLDLDSPRKYETDIYVQKIRFHEVGSIGKVTLTYNPFIQNYH